MSDKWSEKSSARPWRRNILRSNSEKGPGSQVFEHIDAPIGRGLSLRYYSPKEAGVAKFGG